MIRVVYPGGIHDTVTPQFLDFLLESNRITHFLRSSGWVRIGRDPIRGKKTQPHKGEERRNPEARDFSFLAWQKMKTEFPFPE